MYYPNLEETKQLVKNGVNLVPIYREVQADLETPVSAYLKIAEGPYSFLLESVEGGERLARYSFLGTEPYKVIKTGSGTDSQGVDPLIAINEELSRYKPAEVEGLPRFLGGAVGYLAFECVKYFEPRIKENPINNLGIPESIFLFSDTLLLFDHLRHKIQVVSHARIEGDVEQAYQQAITRIDNLVHRLEQPLPMMNQGQGQRQSDGYTANVTQAQYHQMVNRAQEYIVAGDVIQVVPSQRLARPTSAHPFSLYRSLRAVNPSPFMYYFHLDDFDIVGASPELLVRVENGSVYTHPIAGTRRRGATEAEDLALEKELHTDEKELAEHIMLLDLGRNDIGRVSKPGTVEATKIMEVERYSHVMHLVSHVTGQLAPGITPYDALRACFPAGTVSGAPKIRAIEIITELEPEQRGVYSGAIGYFSFSGNMDTAIAIRTMVVKDGVAYLQAGGGVVYDSIPELEYQESFQKMEALLRAIANAESRI